MKPELELKEEQNQTLKLENQTINKVSKKLKKKNKINHKDSIDKIINNLSKVFSE